MGDIKFLVELAVVFLLCIIGGVLQSPKNIQDSHRNIYPKVQNIFYKFCLNICDFSSFKLGFLTKCFNPSSTSQIGRKDIVLISAMRLLNISSFSQHVLNHFFSTLRQKHFLWWKKQPKIGLTCTFVA